jgi:hypothetical protein
MPKCPYCNHINVIPASTIEFDQSGNIIKAYLLDAKIPENDLLKFVDVIKRYIDNNDLDQVAFKKELKAINPKLQKILDLVIPKTASGFYGLLVVLLTLITTFLIDNKSSSIINSVTINNISAPSASAVAIPKSKAHVEKLKRKKKRKNKRR